MPKTKNDFINAVRRADRTGSVAVALGNLWVAVSAAADLLEIDLEAILKEDWDR